MKSLTIYMILFKIRCEFCQGSMSTFGAAVVEEKLKKLSELYFLVPTAIFIIFRQNSFQIREFFIEFLEIQKKNVLG